MSAEEALSKAGMKKEDIDFLVPHQANIRIIDAAVERFGLSEEKVIVNLDRYGNMSSASIPVALDEAVQGTDQKGGHAGARRLRRRSDLGGGGAEVVDGHLMDAR